MLPVRHKGGSTGTVSTFYSIGVHLPNFRGFYKNIKRLICELLLLFSNDIHHLVQGPLLHRALIRLYSPDWRPAD